MSSKSSSYVSTVNNQDQINGLASVKGDGNTTTVLDGDAIKQAFTFGTAATAGQNQTIGDVLNTIDSVAGKAIAANAESSAKTIAALQSGLSQASGSIQSAYSKSASGGLDPQVVLLGVGVLAVLAFILKG